jgi:membrane protein DedA with SNARE-associated domain
MSFSLLAISRDPYDEWSRANLTELHGLTPEMLQGPPPATLYFDYRAAGSWPKLPTALLALAAWRHDMKAGAVAAGGLATLGLLLMLEAVIPVPLPADLVMFTVGERVAAGAFALWLAVAGFEVISVIGTTVLFLACRGPAHQVIARLGPRVGLSQARVRRTAAFVETRGRLTLAAGRGTPGLRTLTVVAAGASGLSWRRALPALILGSSTFLQLHLVLGLLLGPLPDRAFNQAKGPALARLAVLAIASPAGASPPPAPGSSPKAGPPRRPRSRAASLTATIHDGTLSRRPVGGVALKPRRGGWP